MYNHVHYSYTWRHAHALTLLVPVEAKNNQIPDFLAAQHPDEQHLLDEIRELDPDNFEPDDDDTHSCRRWRHKAMFNVRERTLDNY